MWISPTAFSLLSSIVMGDWKESYYCPFWKKSESVRIGKCQNRKSVRIGKVSESESVRIGKILTLSNSDTFQSWHFPVSHYYARKSPFSSSSRPSPFSSRTFHPGNPSFDVSELLKTRRSTDFEALKLQKRRVGFFPGLDYPLNSQLFFLLQKKTALSSLSQKINHCLFSLSPHFHPLR